MFQWKSNYSLCHYVLIGQMLNYLSAYLFSKLEDVRRLLIILEEKMFISSLILNTIMYVWGLLLCSCQFAKAKLI